MVKFYMKGLFIALMAMVSTVSAFAADVDVWTAGKIQAVVDKEECNAAGMVYASVTELTSEADIAAVEGLFQAEPEHAFGNAYASTTGHTWYFYAKANPGYKFVGFASSKTGTPTGTNAADKLAMVGDFYTVAVKPAAPYKEYTKDAPKLSTRYAVFEKISEGGEGGEGGETGPLPNFKAIGALYPKTVAVGEGNEKTGVTQYVNLVGANLTANGSGDFTQGDQVTHIYIQFDTELANIAEASSASKALASQVSLVNKTTGKVIAFNQYSCVLWSKDAEKKTLDLLISSEDYIINEDYQGEYEFKLPAGVVKSAKGAVNDAYEFTFTYGDPSQAKPEEIINLADYIGVWKQSREAGEVIENPGSFYLEKIGEEYYLTNIHEGKELQVLIINNENKFTLKATSSNGYSFGTTSGGDVDASFKDDNGTKAIFLGLYRYVAPGQAEPIIGGECGFKRTSTEIPTAIKNVENKNLKNQIFDLQGRRVVAPAKGLYIINGKKVVR